MESNEKASAKQNNIFISYRRDDSSGETGRLIDWLKKYFDEQHLFMDIDKLVPGVNFTEAIPKYLDSSSAMLVIIGSNWVGKKADGTLRIQNSNDWVRIEVDKALKRKMHVVPVMIDGAQLPASSDLPEDLQPLLTRQKYEISNSRWAYDVEQLAHYLVTTMGIIPKEDVVWNYFNDGKPSKKKARTLWIILPTALILIVLIFLWQYNGNTDAQKQCSKKNLTKEQIKELNYELEAAEFARDSKRFKQALEHYRKAQKIAGDDPKIEKSITEIQNQLEQK